MSVGKVGERGDRPHLPADVRGAGDGDEVDPRPRGPERALTSVQQLVCRAGEPEQPEIVAAPGKHVGVMLDRAREHARPRAQGGRQDVDGFGGVADEHDRVVVARADELADGASRVLERGGRYARLPTAATVHAAVPGHEPLDGIPHGGHHRSTGRVVEVHVPARATVGTGHNRVGADHSRERLVRAPEAPRHGMLSDLSHVRYLLASRSLRRIGRPGAEMPDELLLSFCSVGVRRCPAHATASSSSRRHSQSTTRSRPRVRWPR